MKDGFIVIAIDDEQNETYISNTSPILWTDKLEEAKHFTSFNNAKNELEDNFLSLSATISYTNIKSILICEYKCNIIVERSIFL